MSWRVEIADARGRRAPDGDPLPLSLGGEGCDVTLPGDLPREPVAWIGVDREHAFVQPAGADARVTANGRPLAQSAWIADGDVIGIGEAEVVCRIGDRRIELSVRARPPAVSPPAEPPASPPVGRRRAGGAGRGLRWALLAAFAVLVVAAGFVFLATPVEIAVEPAGARVDLDGALPTVTIGGRRLAAPGAYRVLATHPGYRPLERRIDVGGGTVETVELVLEKLPGVVGVVSTPVDGARVWIDDAPAGATPLAGVEIAAGTHRLRLARERYLDAEAEVEVTGMGEAQTFTVALTPGWSPIGIDSVPPGATVTVDGEALGTTPLTADLMAGERSIGIALARHDPLTVTVDIEANAPMNLPPFELVESDAVLALASRPSGATVSIDGAFRGRTPLEVPLAPRVAHEVSLTLPGYALAERRVALDPAARESLSVGLAAVRGTVFVTAEPPDAELLVDGEPRGLANQRLDLLALPHRIEVRREGYASHTVTITPRPGAAQSLDVRLETVAEARVRGTPDTVTTAEGQRLRLVRPPPGAFRLGASRREPGRRANEGLRDVILTRPFYLGLTEVTNAEFRHFRPAHRSGDGQAVDLDGDAQPVAAVTWNDAAAYLNWLSERDGLPPAYEKRGEEWFAIRPPTTGYRLPTEAEWAYVARHAGAGPRKYPWGEGFPPTGRAGNYADQSAEGVVANVLDGYRDGFPGSAPPGNFDAVPLDFSDLGGNVAEWCQDFYAVYPDGSPTLRDPLGPETGKHHVVRGSSWRHSGITELRLSYRDYAREARPDLGFRIARYAY